MKTVMTALLAMALFIPAMAFAQDTQQQDDKNSQAQQNQAAQVDQMGGTTLPQHNMSGMVSDGGRSLTSDNKTYAVNNPKSLKKYDNQTVSVVFQFNTDNNTIHIISVSPGQ